MFHGRANMYLGFVKIDAAFKRMLLTVYLEGNHLPLAHPRSGGKDDLQAVLRGAILNDLFKGGVLHFGARGDGPIDLFFIKVRRCNFSKLARVACKIPFLMLRRMACLKVRNRSDDMLAAKDFRNVFQTLSTALLPTLLSIIFSRH